MDLLTGAVVAAGTGFASIVAAVFLPRRFLPLHALRVVGGASLTLLGLVVLGLPLPSWLPLAVLGLGMAGAIAFGAGSGSVAGHGPR